MMMDATFSYETLVFTRSAPHYIPEDNILHIRCRKNLKSYIKLTGWNL
jgi:hypothetical protein